MSEPPEDNIIVGKVKDLHNDYYSNSQKNILFKNQQKFNCASVVCQNIPIKDLISQTVFFIPDTNHVYVDYTIFKLFANPDNFKIIIDNIILMLHDRIISYNNFQLHINLNSFTISALERYRTLIKYFCDKCLASDTKYSKLMEKLFIYHPPKSFDAIVKTLKPFIDPQIYNKFTLCNDVISFEQVKYYNTFRL
jgi:hypothetical protein